MYFGHYTSSTSERICVKEFFTTATEAMRFPPQVNYHCDTCDKVHPFKYKNLFRATTPGQNKKLDEYCKEHNIERDVEVPIK